MAKSNRKQVLGRGLSAILSDPNNSIESASNKNTDQLIGKVIDLPLKKITTNPNQPRTYFNEEALRRIK